MPSSEHTDPGVAAIRRFEEWRAKFNAAVDARDRRIKQIVDYARSKGLDANYAMVSRHLPWFERWYASYLATGHLMNRTGVKMIPRDVNRERSM